MMRTQEASLSDCGQSLIGPNWAFCKGLRKSFLAELRAVLVQMQAPKQLENLLKRLMSEAEELILPRLQVSRLASQLAFHNSGYLQSKK